jgi:hypothetical protein
MTIIESMDNQIIELQKQLDAAIKDAGTNGNVSKSCAGNNIIFYTEAIDRIVNTRQRYLGY